jgi:hypothetical protein
MQKHDRDRWTRMTETKQDKQNEIEAIVAKTVKQYMDGYMDACAETMALKDTLRQLQKIMGPKVPKCCQGCRTEWQDALNLIKAKLKDNAE